MAIVDIDKKSFVFYKEWRDAIQGVSDEVRLEVYDGIIEYAFSGKVPSLKPLAQMAFNFIKGDLDRDFEKYEQTVKKRSEAGKKGGRPKVEKKQTEAKKAFAFFEKQTEAKKADNVNEDDNVNDNVLLEKETKDFENLEIQNSEFFKAASEFFSQTTEIQRMKMLGDLLRIHREGKLSDLSEQTTAYMSYKQTTGESVHRWQNYIQEWQNENWVELLKKQNEKPNSKTRPTSSGKISGTSAILSGTTYSEFADDC